MSLFLGLEVKWMGYGYFEFSQSLVFKRLGVESQNGYRLLIWPHIQKNKDTFFSPTFKIEENKVPLFFRLEVKCMG